MMSASVCDIHLCRAHDIKAGVRSTGARLLVDRLWPRGISKTDLPLDAWLKDVAPSPALRIWYGHDPAKWAEFGTRYRAELRDNPEAVESALAWCRRGPASLIYAAKDRLHTHALVLRDHLAETLAKEYAQ